MNASTAGVLTRPRWRQRWGWTGGQLGAGAEVAAGGGGLGGTWGGGNADRGRRAHGRDTAPAAGVGVGDGVTAAATVARGYTHPCGRRCCCRRRRCLLTGHQRGQLRLLNDLYALRLGPGRLPCADIVVVDLGMGQRFRMQGYLDKISMCPVHAHHWRREDSSYLGMGG